MLSGLTSDRYCDCGWDDSMPRGDSLSASTKHENAEVNNTDQSENSFSWTHQQEHPQNAVRADCETDRNRIVGPKKVGFRSKTV